MDVMTVLEATVGILISSLLLVITFFLRRWVEGIDKKFDVIFSNLRDQGITVIEVKSLLHYIKEGLDNRSIKVH